MMIELHIYLEPFEGKEKALESLYLKDYVPGIEIQEGFLRTTLLKKRDALREYQIDIAFDTEDLRLKWVKSKEHQAIWPKMAALCQRASWAGFDTVSK
jgi:heme-degrading monooxygenase HmoA